MLEQPWHHLSVATSLSSTLAVAGAAQQVRRRSRNRLSFFILEQ